MLHKQLKAASLSVMPLASHIKQIATKISGEYSQGEYSHCGIMENRGEPWRTVKASNGLEMFSAKLCSFCISSTLKTLTMFHSNHEQSNYKGREKMAKAQFVKSHRPRKSAGNFQEQRGPHHSQVKCIRHVHTCSRFAQVYQSST